MPRSPIQKPAIGAVYRQRKLINLRGILAHGRRIECYLWAFAVDCRKTSWAPAASHVVSRTITSHEVRDCSEQVGRDRSTVPADRLNTNIKLAVIKYLNKKLCSGSLPAIKDSFMKVETFRLGSPSSFQRVS